MLPVSSKPFYKPSPRSYPDPLPQVEYPGHFEVRKVRRTVPATSSLVVIGTWWFTPPEPESSGDQPEPALEI